MERVREHWSSKIGFLFAAIGSAVGLGVLWKFPYTVGQNGGGLFLLAYVLCVMIIGVPVFIAEILMGRTAQRAAVGTFTQLCGENHVWKVTGWLGVISSFLIMSFYSVIAGWGMSYIIQSLSGFYRGLTAAEVRDVFTILEHSGDIVLVWHFIFTLITMLIVFSGVRAGIEYWSRIMTRALFLILISLVLYSATLPGFGKALHYLFYPDFSTFKFSSILEALGLAFFTLSLGQGIMFSYGSYMKSDDNVPEMACVVGGAVVFVAILGALTVFPVVFSFGFEPSAGTGLVFQTLPYLFARLPGAQVISVVFFALFVFCAITSAVAFIEVVATNLMELLQWERKKAVLLVSLATFIVGIPSALAASRGVFFDWPDIYGTNFLETIDRLVSVWLIPVGGLLTALFVGWVWDREESYKAFMKGCPSKSLWMMWHLSMRWLIPVLILLIILQKSEIINFDSLFIYR